MAEQNRLRDLIDALELRPYQFAALLGISNQCLNNWLIRPLSKSNVNTIVTAIPNINPDWLLHGAGDMFIKPIDKLPQPTTNILDIFCARIAYLEKQNERLLSIIEKLSSK